MARFDVDNSAVNTAIASSIFDLSAAQKAVAAAVFGFTKKLSLVNTDKYKIDGDTKATLKTLEQTTSALNTKLAELQEDKANDDVDKRNTIKSLSIVATALGQDKDSSKRFNDNIATLNSFIQNTSRVSISTSKVFDSIANINDKFSQIDFPAVGKGLLLIAGGINCCSGP
jgi:hypothetical protein